MTEQTVETEQEFLGNVATAPAQAYIGSVEVGEVDVAVLPKIPLQSYAPAAHLFRGPLWSPADNVELSALVRKSIAANKVLAIAKAESGKAENALQLALGVEDEAAVAAHEADMALVAFTRKDTGL